MNAKKHLFLASMLLSATAMTFTSCNDDDWKDVDGASPSLALTTEAIRTEAGRKIHIAGTVTDADGISTIGLACKELLLNKTIDIIDIYGEPLKEYELDYAVTIPSDGTADEYNVDVTVTDIGGRKDVHHIRVTLDGDFQAPVFTASPDKEITVLIKPKTTFKLSFTATDNRVIDYVEVDLKDITNGEDNAVDVSGFPLRLEGNGSGSFEYAQALTIPSVKSTLKATITAYDKAAQDPAHSTSITSLIEVSELPDLPAIYLADVATAAELNSDVFGVPMVMDHVGAYKYRVRYYNEKAGTEICFLAQKTDFGPICFGPDPADPKILGDDPDEVGRIKLDQAGVYYVIDVNTLDRTYSLSTYPVSEAVNPVSHLHYGDYDLNTWWETNPNNDGDIWWQEWWFGPTDGPNGENPEKVPHMVQDAKNPNIFILENWNLEGGKTVHFTFHNWHSHGWWNFTAWRVDDPADPSKFAYYGNYIPSTSHYASNDDYFNFKYINVDKDEYNFMYPTAGDFDLGKWGDEGYRKNFVPDNWADVMVQASGSYNLIFDAHTERAKLVPAK